MKTSRREPAGHKFRPRLRQARCAWQADWLVVTGLCRSRQGSWRSVNSSQHGFWTKASLTCWRPQWDTIPLNTSGRSCSKIRVNGAFLEVAAERAGWGSPPPTGVGRGTAFVASFGTIVAQWLRRARLQTVTSSSSRGGGSGLRQLLPPQYGRATDRGCDRHGLKRGNCGADHRRALSAPRARADSANRSAFHQQQCPQVGLGEPILHPPRQHLQTPVRCDRAASPQSPLTIAAQN